MESAREFSGPFSSVCFASLRPPVEEIEALGFTRDRELEDHLRLFAGLRDSGMLRRERI